MVQLISNSQIFILKPARGDKAIIILSYYYNLAKILIIWLSVRVVKWNVIPHIQSKKIAFKRAESVWLFLGYINLLKKKTPVWR